MQDGITRRSVILAATRAATAGITLAVPAAFRQDDADAVGCGQCHCYSRGPCVRTSGGCFRVVNLYTCSSTTGCYGQLCSQEVVACSCASRVAPEGSTHPLTRTNPDSCKSRSSPLYSMRFCPSGQISYMRPVSSET